MVKIKIGLKKPKIPKQTDIWVDRNRDLRIDSLLKMLIANQRLQGFLDNFESDTKLDIMVISTLLDNFDYFNFNGKEFQRENFLILLLISRAFFYLKREQITECANDLICIA
jgi:hypothetical protein